MFIILERQASTHLSLIFICNYTKDKINVRELFMNNDNLPAEDNIQSDISNYLNKDPRKDLLEDGRFEKLLI